MKFLIIIPAHNEEKYIISCLQSLENQVFQDCSIVVVNDGSTDAMENILNEFKKKTTLENFFVIHREKSTHEPGQKIVQAFYYGLNWALEKGIDFDIIAKIDADIIFPSDYFYIIGEMFEVEPDLGMASGIVKINPSGKMEADIFDFSNENQIWQYENISSKNHVRGPIKAYRRACFEEMKGLRPVLGWDNIDVMLAQKMGWKVKTKKKIWVKHLRPTATHYSHQKAEKMGIYFYNIGLSVPLVILSALKASWQGKSVWQFFRIMKSYLHQNHHRVLTDEEVVFIRKLRWKQLRDKWF